MGIPLIANMTEEKEKLISEKLDKRNNADYQCYVALRDFLSESDPMALAEALNCNCGLEDEEPEQLVKALQDAVYNREKANDEFLRAVAS